MELSSSPPDEKSEFSLLSRFDFPATFLFGEPDLLLYNFLLSAVMATSAFDAVVGCAAITKNELNYQLI